MEVHTIVSRETSSKAGLGAVAEENSSQAYHEGRCSKASISLSVDLYIYIYFFFLHCVKWKQKQIKFKKIGTNEYINMILFVEIKNFIVTCISVLNKLLSSIVWVGKSLPSLFSLY